MDERMNARLNAASEIKKAAQAIGVLYVKKYELEREIAKAEHDLYKFAADALEKAASPEPVAQARVRQVYEEGVKTA